MKFKELNNCKVIMDFNNQVWRNFHATEGQNLINSDGINTGCILGLIKVFNYAIKRSKEEFLLPSLVIIEDRWPERKHNLYKEHQSAFKDYGKIIKYKGTRKKKEYKYNPIDICRQFVDCIPHIKLWAEKEEADDIIAAYISKNKNAKIFLYSTDRDLWQLLAKYKNVEIVLGDTTSPDENGLIKSFKSEHVTFDKIFLYKVIRGDAGDNIKSVYRFPFKKTIKSFIRCNGTVENYVKCIEEDFGKDSKEFNQLIDNSELIRLNMRLVKLSEDVKYQTQIIEKPDLDKWRKLCSIFETPSIINTGLMNIF